MIVTEEATISTYNNRQGAIDTLKNNTRVRNNRIQNRFNQLYNENRMRYDDVINTLCEEFFLSKRRIETVMKGQ